MRSEADEYSDLDLIIIKKTADIFVYTPEEFERMKENKNPFIENALHSSKIIYEKS